MGGNLFSLDFMGQEVILPKRDIVFKNGLGLVSAYGYYGIGDNFVTIPLVAIVDKNYFPVLSLTPRQLVPKIEMLDNGDIICIIKENSEYNDSSKLIYHYYVDENGEKFVFEIDADAYEIVGSHSIKLCTFVDGRYMYSLYDLVSQSSSYLFDKIGLFQDNQEFGKTALATAFIYDGDMIVNNVSCEISERGEVVSSYREANTGALFDRDMLLCDVIAQVGNLGR